MSWLEIAIRSFGPLIAHHPGNIDGAGADAPLGVCFLRAGFNIPLVGILYYKLPALHCHSVETKATECRGGYVCLKNFLLGLHSS